MRKVQRSHQSKQMITKIDKIFVPVIGILLAATLTSINMRSFAADNVILADAPYSDSASLVGTDPMPSTEDVVSSTSNIIYSPELYENSSFMEQVVETTEAPTETQPARSYTDEDLQYLTMVLTGECQNRNFDTQLKYGSVVLNRVASSKYPNTIKGVCLQKHQYACFSDGNAYRTPTETSIAAAKYLLENGSVYPANVVFQSREKQGSGVYEKVAGEYFCY